MKYKRPEAIIIDLDGTLCDSSKRVHFLSGSTPDYKSFYEESSEDAANEWCVEIVNKFINTNCKVLFITGRPEKYRGITEGWILKVLGIPRYRYKLLMREDNNYQPDFEVKKSIYYDHVESLYDVMFCIDDRKQVVNMWKSLGLECLHC